MDTNICLHAYISGRVQGVGFRSYVTEVANMLDLVGCVANVMDGKVEVISEGPQSNLEEFVEYLKHGPRLARVIRVDCDWGCATGEFSSFTIEHGG